MWGMVEDPICYGLVLSNSVLSEKPTTSGNLQNGGGRNKRLVEEIVKARSLIEEPVQSVPSVQTCVPLSLEITGMSRGRANSR